LIILDADLTVQPEELVNFVNAIVSGRGDDTQRVGNHRTITTTKEENSTTSMDKATNFG
jgi:hypothetical protein